ncbi:MAG TPA: hypothetical protein PK054_06035 [Anaerohalosphaeraceae bacterium]|nr:hypothetical protein [Anaerohalosphaeraceae bacterium]HOL88947.1 hypothetical protein [Anaerohalosphaeraceae bacterium]HPP56127.1 hypothetical protein [Anaerohalosphaeraceae bacterium]
MAKQITVFLENRPGRIQSISRILKEKGLNILAFSIQDRGEFGLMKMIVDKPAEAQLALADRGMACALKEVFAVTAADQPGNLEKLTTALAEKSINIKDAYGFVSTSDKRGICYLEVENPQNVDIGRLIAEHGFTLIADKDLYDL